MGCNGTTVDDQDIRLVCTSDDAACDHIYQGGAVGTVVRLPESCGAGPFAVVTRAWVPADQSVPEAVQQKLSRRQEAPEVKALTLSTNFAAVNTTKYETDGVVIIPQLTRA
jgi:hypothetical protein